MFLKQSGNPGDVEVTYGVTIMLLLMSSDDITTLPGQPLSARTKATVYADERFIPKTTGIFSLLQFYFSSEKNWTIYFILNFLVNVEREQRPE